MAMVSLGDMAQSFLLRNQNAKLRSDLLRHGQEVSTGRVQDLGKRVGGDYAPLAGIERSLARIDAFGTTAREAGIVTETMQSALSAISELATGFAPGLLLGEGAALPAHIDALGEDGHSRFETALSRLNTRVGDRSLFAGTATDGPAVANADTILTALSAVIAGATTATQVAQAVSDWFDDPAGFATVGYVGSNQDISPVTVAEGTKVSIGARADAPEIADTLKGLAMAALLGEGALAGDATGRAELANLAGEQLLAAQTDWSVLQARIGVSQERLAEAEARNSAESSSLQIARTKVLSVDPYDAATALQETQTQLETLYTITARITRLSLKDYL